MIRGLYTPTFLLHNLKKDLGLITEFAESHQINLEGARTIDQVYQDAIDRGFGNLDYTGILHHIETLNDNKND